MGTLCCGECIRTFEGMEITDIMLLPTLATACCVLHNICEIHGDNFDDEWLVPEAVVASAPQAATSAPSGDKIRAALCDYFDTV